MFDSNAILLYLAEKTDQFLPDPQDRHPAGFLQRRCSSTATGRGPSYRKGHVDPAYCRSSMGYEAPSDGRADRSTPKE